MPLNDYRCDKCGFIEERFVALVDVGKTMDHEHLDGSRGWMQIVHLRPPMVAVDLPAYTSPIDGRLVNGRVQRRNDLARSDCVPYEPGMKEDFLKRKQADENAFDRKIEDTVEAEIHRMPARKREKLASELESGADVTMVRQSA